MFRKLIALNTYRSRLIAAFSVAIVIAFVSNLGFIYAYTANTNIYTPPDYLTFTPPSVGGSYTDPVFGTAVKRLSNAMTVPRADGVPGMVITSSPEYSTMTPFNNDNTKLLIEYFSYFALYDGAGNYLRDLPFEVNASSEPRWSRQDPNVLYYIRGNQLKKYTIGTNTASVVHTFSEYSSIRGAGESDISFDGNYFVFAGDSRNIFVYNIPSDTKGPTFDTGGRGYDSLYISADNNVTITWNANGAARYNGIEMFDKNMNFLRQLATAGGHMDMSRDLNGDEVLIWTNSADPRPIPNCDNGIVKIRLADGRQTCLLSLDWSMAVHISGTDNSGWVFVETYIPSDPRPPAGWPKFANEILQIKLDGSEVRRLVHHRSRPFNSYTYMPKVSSSRDGSKIVYGSNFGLQAISGNPSEYQDAYLIDISTTSPGTTGSASPSAPSTPAPTPSTPSTPTPAPVATTTRVEQNGSGVVLTGNWMPNSMSVHSGASAVLAMDSGSRATFTFNGTGATWIAYTDEWSGVARVFVDGTLKGEVDTYASPNAAQVKEYSVSGLTSGTHTLAIEATQRKSAASAGSWVWVDAFDVMTASAPAAPAPTPAAPAPAPVAPAPAPAAPAPAPAAPAPAPAAPAPAPAAPAPAPAAPAPAPAAPAPAPAAPAPVPAAPAPVPAAPAPAPSTAVAGGVSYVSTGGQSLQVGYAEVSANSSGVTPAGLAIFGYRKNGVLVSEAGVPASAPVLRGRIYAETAGVVNTGFAIANPNDTEAAVSFFFTDQNGNQSGSGNITLLAHGQLARFLNESPFNGSQVTSGSFTFNSNRPVSAIALRGFTNERSEFMVTTLPIASLDAPSFESTVFPHFADGGGWTTQFVLVNPSDQAISGTLQLNSTAVSLESQSGSVQYTIPARGSRRFSTSGSGSNIQVGSAMVLPSPSNATPVGVAVFSFKNAGVTVSEAGVSAVAVGTAFRVYAEFMDGLRTGVAVMNASNSEQQVTLELTSLDGKATGLTGSMRLAALGQRAMFLNEIPGFQSLPADFKGILRISSAGNIAAMGLRGRVNERGDFLITTTNPTRENEAPAGRLVFPHIVDGAGYTTQFLLYSGAAAQPATGQLNLFSQSGGKLDITVR